MTVIDLGVLIAPTKVDQSLALYQVQDLNAGIDLATVGQEFTFETPATVFSSQYAGAVAIYYEYADHVVVLEGVYCHNSTNLQPSTQYTARITSVAQEPDSIYETAVLI
ncbi:MAG: hypothetical protein N2171_02055 [Clostridia bacterium]|nr:hypothetical protein [Clostridia bacterium]